MALQLILVLLLVLLAAGYLARRVWRTWYGSGCAGCGCSKASASPTTPERRFIPLEQVTLRRDRRGNAN